MRVYTKITAFNLIQVVFLYLYITIGCYDICKICKGVDNTLSNIITRSTSEKDFIQL